MRMVSSSILYGTLILNSIELSLQTSNPRRDVSRFEISSPERRPVTRSSSRSSPHPEPLLRARSKSPPGSTSLPFLLGYSSEDYKSIRLIPHSNPSRQFEIKKYTFLRNNLLHLRGDDNILEPLPSDEQSILSTSDGEVFAIVYDNRRLRGIYTIITGIQRRVKVNMYSGAIERMTKGEIQESPLGNHTPIWKRFKIIHINEELSSQTSNYGPHVARSEIPHSAAGRQALGSSSRSSPRADPHLSAGPSIPYFPSYTSGKIESIRLVPHMNPSRQFEIRNYTFPRDKALLLKGALHSPLPLPTEKQSVLSTSNGEIFAIIEKHEILRGFYTTMTGVPKRAKINMYSSVVEEMTTEEIRETPLGKNLPISKCFDILHMKEDSSSPARHHDPYSLSSSFPHADPQLHARFTSPPGSDSAFYFLKYTLEQLKYIRLIPGINPSRRFQIRRYAIPGDKELKIQADREALVSVPIEEQTVISTSDGEVFGIVYDRRRLRAIFKVISKSRRRVKINMYSGVVTEMTKEEIQEAPCGRNAHIAKCFEILNMKDESSLQTGMSHPPEYHPLGSP